MTNTPDLSGYLTTESQTIADAAALGNSVNAQLKNVTDPTENQDAVTKKYVDELIAALQAQNAALQATVEALTAQSSGSQNGNTCTITFDANGGTGTMEQQVFTPGVSQNLTAQSFSIENGHFVGWNTSPDGTGASYSNRQAISVWSNVTLYAQWLLGQTGQLNGHEWVDLGLPSGTLWATCNVGASSPTARGKCFAWGETDTKTYYTDSTYLQHGLYISISGSGQLVYIKYRTKYDDRILESSDDAAKVNWGSGWRMPTIEEFSELCSNCNRTTTTQNGVTGVLFTSRSNGNSIFIPALGYNNNGTWAGGTSASSGYMFCWSASRDNNINYAMALTSQAGSAIKSMARYLGLPIRPVVAQ